MNLLFSFLAGLVFGIGLIMSGMSNPAKVIGFLDLAGKWDPSLALVMAGAIAVGVCAFTLAKRRHTTWLNLPMLLPGATQLDHRLIVGSVLFGVGWGVAGICPGPGLVLLGTGAPQGLIFVAAMLAGMGVFELLERLARKQRTLTGG